PCRIPRGRHDRRRLGLEALAEHHLALPDAGHQSRAAHEHAVWSQDLRSGLHPHRGRAGLPDRDDLDAHPEPIRSGLVRAINRHQPRLHSCPRVLCPRVPGLPPRDGGRGMSAENRAQGRLNRLIGAALLWLCAVVILLPLAVVVVTSLKSLNEAASLNLSLPRELLFGNYATVFAEGKIIRGIGNSLVVTATATILILLSASVLGFILTRRRTPTTVFMERCITLGLVAPFTALPTIMLLKNLGI